MPKAIVHPHPVFDYRCANCLHWHPAYVENWVINPQTSEVIPIKIAIQKAMKIDAMISDRRSLCTLDPKWEHTGEDHYCSHFKENKIY